MTPTQSGGADLHLHTVYSDGTYTPAALVAAARAQEMAVIAVTDHDTMDAAPLVRREAGTDGPEVVTGVEFGTPTDEENIEETHIVGLFLDEANGRLQESLARFRELRRERALAIIEKLNRCGVPIRAEDVFVLTGEGNVGRLHVARALALRNLVGSVGEAFRRWIGRNGPCYVPRERPSIADTIALIHDAGGVAVMAHPGLTGRDAQIPAFAAMGLDGIEVFCGEHSRQQEAHYLEIARQNSLLVSGGSDCHGNSKEHLLIGEVRLDAARVEALRRRAAERGRK